jgi:hypothetical protein
MRVWGLLEVVNVKFHVCGCAYTCTSMPTPTSSYAHVLHFLLCRTFRTFDFTNLIDEVNTTRDAHYFILKKSHDAACRTSDRTISHDKTRTRAYVKNMYGCVFMAEQQQLAT